MSEKISFRFKDDSERAGVLLQNEQGSLLVDFWHMCKSSSTLDYLDYHYVEAKVRKLSPTQAKLWEQGRLPGSAGTVLSSASAYVGFDNSNSPELETDILSYLPDPKLFTKNHDLCDPYSRTHKLGSPTLEAVVKRAQKLVCDEHQRREELARQQRKTVKAKRSPIEQAEKQKTIEAGDAFLSTFLDSGRND